MILLVGIFLGLVLGVGMGGSMSSLRHVRLRYDAVLLALLVVQAALPALAGFDIARPYVKAAWVATFPLMVVCAWANWRMPGMLLAGSGVFANGLVIVLNWGMPVSRDAAIQIGFDASRQLTSAADVVHAQLGPGTILPLLADVLPLPGPRVLAGVASVGDLALVAGVASFLTWAAVQHNVARVSGGVRRTARHSAGEGAS